MFSFLTSLRLTLPLLLGLAAISVFGTLPGDEAARFDLYYQSLWFRLLLGLLALNLAACTLKTVWRNRHDHRHFLAALPAVAEAVAADAPALERESAVAALKRAGFRIFAGDGTVVLAQKGRLGRWGSTVVHLSCLLIMAGGLAAELGFVGTRFIYVGQQESRVLDWRSQTERDLGFTLRLDRFEPQYYPIDVQITAYAPGSRRELNIWTTREGERFALPTSALVAEVVRFDPSTKELRLRIWRGDVPLGDYRSGVGEHGFREGVDPGVELYPTAFKDPILKQTRSEVTVIENGQKVVRGVIAVNQPLVYRGVAIYQTAFDHDQFGFWYVGFQFSKDPGEPLVWVGCITLSLGLLLAFGLRYRVVALVPQGAGSRLVRLRGFSDAAGGEKFAKLESELQAAAGLNASPGDLR